MMSPAILTGLALTEFEKDNDGVTIVKAIQNGRIVVPYMNKLGIAFEYVAKGHTILNLPVRPELLNENGLVYTGAIASLADSAGLTARTLLPAGKSYLMNSLSLEFMGQRTEGMQCLIAESKAHDGFEGCIKVTTQLTDQDGKPIAAGTLSALALDEPPAVREDNGQLIQTIMPVLNTGHKYLDELGIQRMADGTSTWVRVPVQKALHNSVGTMHGGAEISAVIAESNQTLRNDLANRNVSGRASMSRIHIEYWKKIEDEERQVVAIAKLVKSGHRLAHVDAFLKSANGEKTFARSSIGYVIHPHGEFDIG